MKLIALVVALLPVAAAANPVMLTDCNWGGAKGDRLNRVFCEITNTSEVSVARIRYALIASEPDRAIPWVDEKRLGMTIPGGIEPGETVRMDIYSFDVPDRADRDAVVVDVKLLAALDVNDEAIDGFDQTPDPAPGLATALQDALGAALSQ